MQCIDCKVASTKTVCEKCLSKRKPCLTKGCTTRLNPLADYVYCKSCACPYPKCRDAHLEDATFCFDHNFCKRNGCDQQRPSPTQDFCKTCETQWKAEAPKCVVCRKKKREIDSLLCMSCTNLRPTCAQCKRVPSHVDTSGKKYTFCKDCLCERKGCGNATTAKDTFCTACLQTYSLCGKVGALGTCKNLKSNKKDAQCATCCTAEKCTRQVIKNAGGEYYEYCKTCNWNWERNANATLCIGDDCFEYTSNKTGFCDACSTTARRTPAKGVSPMTPLLTALPKAPLPPSPIIMSQPACAGKSQNTVAIDQKVGIITTNKMQLAAFLA